MLSNSLDQIEAVLAGLVRKRLPATGDRARVVILAGPPGAGKSTVATALAQAGFEVCLERPAENPHLADLLAGKPEAGFPCQDWFLRQVERFLAATPHDRPIAIDQDPAATALVYGRAMRSRGLLGEEDSIALARRLCAVELDMAKRGACLWALLDAPVEVLKRRVTKRASNDAETFWIEELQRHFHALARPTDGLIVDASSAMPAEIVASILKTLDVIQAGVDG